MSLLEARNLGVGYTIPGAGLFGAPRHLPIVHEVSLSLQPGRTLGVVGESGCGKSTLGRALLQLIPSSAGQVFWQGQDMAKIPNLRRRRSEMQIIFQDPIAALDPRMTLGKIVSRPLATFEPELSKAAARARAVEALQQVGLSADFADRYPHELSGGQAQRVGIARAIVGRPKMIICDEPVSALDVSIQAQVINLLMDLQESMGLALVFISHNLAVVRHISHEVMVMCLGRVVEKAPRSEFYARPLHPYSKALMDAVPEPDPRREKGRVGTALPGELPSVLNPPKGCVFATRCPLAAEMCHNSRPLLREVAPERHVACHFVEGA
ncbi:ATP-binding cassette domain-containing protein [Xinfangfangia sp. CPCC 101601]|uniref:ATP-binding cassette domain-containing protein n=1 Tax=Pseudogemmobacter lacusdianii TaxID=3069608 RepID=A0ABU0VXU2_9RHOB|nr:oligopeptide/dipeptide ABC transporter ATP-binding protein [Xinfangfangia sp. CPCC 101601]MDQ2066328.1 ATP-binding cassette domain-containing protein [Xinfangfangia sp. CPCC 101601]